MSIRILKPLPNPVPGPRYIRNAEIDFDYTACVYCERLKRGRSLCCGEDHFETFYVLSNEETVRADDVVILEDMWRASREESDR